jgi:hypothetical protein
VQLAIQSVFAWEKLEDTPSLATLREAMATVPDGPLLAALRRRRGHGRNEYPVTVLWGVLLLTVALRHTGVEACLAELHRNAGLRQLIGIQSESGVPKAWNVSRFQATLGEEPFRTLAQEAFQAMVRRLGEAVPNLGRETAADSMALNARASRGLENQADLKQGLPEPSGGRKEYTDDQGRVTQVLVWNGYKTHLLVDTRHEVVLAYQVTSTKAGDGETLPALLGQAAAALPPQRIRQLAYDKAADSDEVHRLLGEAGISPLIEVRSLWKGEPYRELPGQAAHPVPVLYDEAGTVYCCHRQNGEQVRRRMAFIGHEKSRRTLKYRCPAYHWDQPCPAEKLCNAGKIYGRTVRVRQELDLRRFPDIPRATRKFERLYKQRSAVERVNGRIKVFWGADDGNLAGSRRFHANVAVVMLVHAAFATVLASVPGRTGTLGRMRLGPIQRALQQSRRFKAEVRAAPGS